MKKSILGIVTFILISMNTFAQNTAEEIKTLSKDNRIAEAMAMDGR
jgi:hypothetical protein